MVKRVLITGANAGIGLATALEIAKQGHDMVLACRNRQKAEAAAAQLRAAGAHSVDIVPLDLTDLDSVVACTDLLKQTYSHIDVLINNAGIYNPKQEKTKQGFESHWGVNVLGPVLFTERLLPLLQAAQGARVVHVASMMHLFGHINPKSFYAQLKYRAIAAYAQSKLGNLLYSDALALRLANSGITSNAVHPGAIYSELYRDLPKWQQAFLKRIFLSVDVPARLIAKMTLSDEWSNKTGQYVVAQPPKMRSRIARNINNALQLEQTVLQHVGAYV